MCQVFAGAVVKHADDIGREMHHKDRDTYIPEERTCLTLTIYMHLNRETEQAWRDGVRQLMTEVEQSVRANLPVAALGRPPVIICFSQMPN